MSARRVHVIGVGKRVLEAALPAFWSADEHYAIDGLYARTARPLRAGERELDVRALDELPAFEPGDLVYVAVGKDAVPKVLGRLAARARGEVDLLIDTPVLRFKHLGHRSKLAGWRHVWVPEDCAYLPWIETLRAAVDANLIGRPRTVLFDQSAYAYHGLASAKALLGAERVRSGSRTVLGHRHALRRVRFAGGTQALILEPRDYRSGRFALMGPAGVIGDAPCKESGYHELEVLVEDGLVRGFRVGAIETRLDEREAALTAGDPDGARATARQEAMKRVGFLRILRTIARGEGGYSLAGALDDTVVDYHLEKFGRYVANPLTSPRSPLSRVLFGAAARVLG